MRVKEHFNSWLFKIPVLRNYSAITLGSHIFYSPSLSEYDIIQIRYHELVHIDQIRKTGRIAFYSSYLLYYLAGIIRYRSHNAAYRSIPYEQEAYGN